MATCSKVMIVDKFHVINSYQQRKNSHSANVQKCCSNAAQIFSHFFNDYKASKGRDTNIHPHKPKISILHPFHENWSFLGFVQVLAKVIL